MLEKQIAKKYLDLLGGEIEVACKFGRVDLLTDTYIVEFKNVNAYKSAIGQLLTYKQHFTDKKLMLVTFGSALRSRKLREITDACCHLNIEYVHEITEGMAKSTRNHWQKDNNTDAVFDIRKTIYKPRYDYKHLSKM